MKERGVWRKREEVIRGRGERREEERGERRIERRREDTNYPVST